MQINRRTIIDHINKTGAALGAEGFREEHLPVLDCGLGERAILPSCHLAMMAAVQPFISGAISKTVNVFHDTTVEEIEEVQAYYVQQQSDMPPCPNRGSFMVPSGACHVCLNCGGSSGCG